MKSLSIQQRASNNFSRACLLTCLCLRAYRACAYEPTVPTVRVDGSQSWTSQSRLGESGSAPAQQSWDRQSQGRREKAQEMPKMIGDVNSGCPGSGG